MELVLEKLPTDIYLEIESVVQIKGGKNSRIYKAIRKKSSDLIIKQYFKHKNDKRDRLKTEVTAISFLCRNNIKNIPHLVYSDHEQNIALFEWIDGNPLLPGHVTYKDIDSVIDFLISIQYLRGNNESQTLPDASEAFFSLKDVLNNVRLRLYRLLTQGMHGYGKDIITDYLNNKLVPCFQTIENWCKKQALTWKIDENELLNYDHRILSPSDIGFHNALKLNNGSLVFLDFEYFGWDDPAKMISDFILHPGMTLPESFKQYFVSTMITKLNLNGISNRLKLFYPLFGLKWCTILLNEFVQSDYERRQFSDIDSVSKFEKLNQQAEKATKQLELTMTTYERFPYE